LPQDVNDENASLVNSRHWNAVVNSHQD
jgi:hypothetical protein